MLQFIVIVPHKNYPVQKMEALKQIAEELTTVSDHD